MESGPQRCTLVESPKRLGTRPHGRELGPNRWYRTSTGCPVLGLRATPAKSAAATRSPVVTDPLAATVLLNDAHRRRTEGTPFHQAGGRYSYGGYAPVTPHVSLVPWSRRMLACACSTCDILLFDYQRLSVRQYRSNETAIAISEKPRASLSFKLIRTAN